MMDLQQLATMCQLLRSVATAQKSSQQTDVQMRSMGGVAQLAMRDLRRDKRRMDQKIGSASVASGATRKKAREATRTPTKRERGTKEPSSSGSSGRRAAAAARSESLPGEACASLEGERAKKFANLTREETFLFAGLLLL